MTFIQLPIESMQLIKNGAISCQCAQVMIQIVGAAEERVQPTLRARSIFHNRLAQQGHSLTAGECEDGAQVFWPPGRLSVKGWSKSARRLRQ